MSTPTDQFAQLSIEEDPKAMASPEAVIERAIELQDILSTFDDNELPSEHQADRLNNIKNNMQRPYNLRDRSGDWTISGNLAGTLLQWGSYSEKGWDFLSELRTPYACAMAFYQKLKRRFDKCFESYDEIPETHHGASDAKAKVEQVVCDLERLSDALDQDRQRRSQRDDETPDTEIETLKIALRALEGVCKRTQSLVPSSTSEPSRRTSRRTTSANAPDLSLFNLVIGEPGSESSPFLLDAMDNFSGTALKDSACWRLLVSINGLLNKNGAPDTYVERFEALQQKANDESQAVLSTPGVGGSSGRRRGLEADPRPGSKRPQASAEATPKRGKRSGK